MKDKTHNTYEDPDFVKLYIEANSTKAYEIDKAVEFARTIKPQSKVLDLGCGPGHLSYVIANATNENGDPLNHRVLGTDYSSEMIKEAQVLLQQENMPEFQVKDMTTLESDFEENTFDAIFSNAAILHIELDKVKNVLSGIRKVTKNNGIVFINLKKDTAGTKEVIENKEFLGRNIEIKRDFTYWEGDDFVQEAQKYGLVLTRQFTQVFQSTSGAETIWLNYYFKVQK